MRASATARDFQPLFFKILRQMGLSLDEFEALR
jgi:hypothetical protein